MLRQPAGPLESAEPARPVSAVWEPAFAPRLSAAQPTVAQPTAAFGMEFASAQRPVVGREEREARWRLELAETRAHPFQSAKIFLACFPPVRWVGQK